MNKLINISPITLSLLAGIFTWFITLLGASIVYFFKKVNKTILDIMLSISSGVMLAASIFSLIIPSIEMCQNLNLNKVLIPSLGIILGGLLLVIFDKLFKKRENKQSILLVGSIALHNLPEGLAIGVAFGSVIYNLEGATILSAIALAIGIGIQNFPEGCAVSLPLRCEGYSRNKAFFYGQLSAIVEPIASVIGAILVLKIRYILPFLLSFAAGAMIYVITSELIPESQTNKNKSLVTIFMLIGFIIMMILDVLLG